ncbi:hypothetical protein A3B18_01305 [Candidatus Giovannonibacteria bacterium RIFCSPLOWO2_01_FULL_46_13]|uniref:VanZ-like domain-containing protein n=1 Tax=Candidatus Giovannonibacteria bacterium RIFCSPLOWO2_01_FULL_46_13 TaxID=1798352 RepID=A0A1F5X4T8_9BACT|nr:MAG: hypothetical protein A3B18_01305 [Candidatus Giovannonibacteria bacterium RIFCSPLOWO2_01_FULL_46_13]
MLSFVLSRRFLVFSLLLIILVHSWAVLTSAYFHYQWLDIVMHATGGFWIGLFAIFLVKNISYPYVIAFWLVLGLVAIVGILWEFFEFGMSQIGLELGRAAFIQPGLEDTLGDLLADLLGGAAAFILFQRRKEIL